MRVYIVAPRESADEVDHYADAIRRAGHVVERGDAGLDGVARCDVLMCFSDPSGLNDLGAEFGLAQAQGRHIFVVGPEPGPRHRRAEVQHFVCWSDCVLKALEDLW